MHTLSNITKCLHEAFWQTWWSMERSGEVSNSSSRGSGTELTLGSGPTIFTYTEGSKDSNIQVDSIRTKKKYPSIIAQAAARATLQGESRRYYIRKLSIYRQCPRRPRIWWSTSAKGPRTKGKTKIFHKKRLNKSEFVEQNTFVREALLKCLSQQLKQLKEYNDNKRKRWLKPPLL